MFALILAAAMGLADPTAAAAPGAVAPTSAPTTVSPATVTAAKPPPKMICHSETPVGSRLPVKVCTRPGVAAADDRRLLDLLQQRSLTPAAGEVPGH